jgi:hypothetical protein
MRIFLGSSLEAVRTGLLRKVAGWIEAEGHTPIQWNAVGVFPAGTYTFATLRQIARDVDAAVFIFAEDDDVWYRTDKVTQPRDNVLLEYGLFTAALGEGKVIICRAGKPRIATDLSGITYIDLADSRMVHAETMLCDWMSRLMAPDSGSLLVERMNSPFQASGKQSLFLNGTELVRRASRRVALVAKTPIVIVGCRPFNDSHAPFSYEVDQLATYLDLIEKSSAGDPPEFICVASRPTLMADVRTYGNTKLPERVMKNLLRLYKNMETPGSRTRLRWYNGTAPMTFLVCDDDFMIWLKDESGESVWITARNEIIARALYAQAESMGTEADAQDLLQELASIA